MGLKARRWRVLMFTADGKRITKYFSRANSAWGAFIRPPLGGGIVFHDRKTGKMVSRSSLNFRLPEGALK